MVESISSPSASHGAIEAIEYCADQVKRYDRDRYTICAGASRDVRGALFALYAFNLEVAKIREVVSEPILGQIRLQWWREAIDGIYRGSPRDHAVVTALAAAIDRHIPTRARFERLIDAREFDMEDRQPDTVEDLTRYVDATSGELACLALEMLGVDDSTLFEKARLAGAAWALNGLLLAVPFHAAQRRCYLPRALTEACGVSIDKLYAGSGDAGLRRAVSDITGLARQYPDAARQDESAMVFHARPAFAGLSLVADDLERLEKAGYDVFSVRPAGPFRRRWLLIMDIAWGR